MGRHKQPDEQAKLKGADKVNPGRYLGTVPKHSMGIGDVAPVHLSEGATVCWFEIVGLAIPGVLTAADSIMVEIAANLLSEYRANPIEFQVGKYTHLISVLARFGMSPTDRNKLALAEEKPSESWLT